MADASPISSSPAPSVEGQAAMNRRQWSLTSAYYLSFVCLGLASAVLGPSLPHLASQTQTRLSQVSILFTATAGGYLAGSLLSGRFYDRAPGHLLVGAGLVVMAAMLALTPFSPWLWLLVPIVALLGAAKGAVDVGGNTLLVWVHGRSVGPFMGGLHFCWGIGALASPIIVGAALSLAGEIGPAFWTLSLLLLPVAAWLVRLPSPAAPSDGQMRVEPGQGTEVGSRSGPCGRLVALLVTLLLFLYVGVESGYGGWIYSFTLAQGPGSAAAAIYVTSAFWGAFTLGRLLGIPVASRVRPRWILLGAIAGCLASMGVLLWWPQSTTATWAATLGMGLFMAPVFPSALTLAGRRISITGAVMGWFLVGASLGGMTLPLLMGQLFEAVSPQSAMALLATYLILALAVLLALLHYSERGLSIHSGLVYNDASPAGGQVMNRTNHRKEA